MIICTYEDRPQYLTGVKLLVLSLRRHCPDLVVEVSLPPTLLTSGFERWLSAQPNACLAPPPEPEVRGWDVKPHILARALAAGHTQALWMDADILVARDFRALMHAAGHNAVVVTQESAWGPCPGGVGRTRAWGMEVGRALPVTANTAVLGVGRAHQALLEDWARLLAQPQYRAAQPRPWRERPVHLLSDQEVLTALLGSTTYADVPIHWLHRGRDIAHLGGAAGYTACERLGSLFRKQGGPALLHAQGLKPWLPASWHERIHLQLSPYTAEARCYADALDEDVRWMTTMDLVARVMRAAALGQTALQGLPLALADTLARGARRTTAALQPDRGPQWPQVGRRTSPCADVICPRPWAQAVIDARLRIHGRFGLPGRVLRKGLTLLRDLLIPLGDPPVRHVIRGQTLLMPVSHNLPVFLHAAPAYMANLVDVACLVRSKYPDLTAIDIGANVGDTVAFLRAAGPFPVLCIEGDAGFFRYLRVNARQWGPDVELEMAMVGSAAAQVQGRLVSHFGTAQLVADSSQSGTIRLRTLPQIVADHPRFTCPKFVKCDTDGYDSLILRAHGPWLKRTRSVLFFEYAPAAARPFDSDPFALFDALRQAGYHGVVCYRNTGQLHTATTLNHMASLRRLHDVYADPCCTTYLDIAAFHREDADLFGQASRGGGPQPLLRQAA